MNVSITCPMCQRPDTKSVNEVNNNYITTSCSQCRAKLHFDILGQIHAYFLDLSHKGQQYELVFHVLESPAGLSKANTFQLSYSRKGKWETILELPFLPHITADNAQTKLQTMLTFL